MVDAVMAVADKEEDTAPTVVAAGHETHITDEDRDSLFILPMSILPLQTPGLRRARMIKDSRLNSVIELFNDKKTGRGRSELDDLEQIFPYTSDELTSDIKMLREVGALHSFDVYSLRIQLRNLNIPVENQESLRISEARNLQLNDYMREFTQPLLRQVYGGNDANFGDMTQLIDMFQSPDKDRVIQNIINLSESLSVAPHEVPEFLQAYGDVFLSLAYYKDILDDLVPRLTAFADEMPRILDNHQVRQNARIAEACGKLDDRFRDIATSITGRFESFERNSMRLWDDVTAEKFAAMKAMITGHYTTIGAVLCGLTVKMKAWEAKFPAGRGGPVSKADFIMSEMRAGVALINEIEQSAPAITDI